MWMNEPDWNEIRELLAHEIQVFYVRDDRVNRQREIDKERTINWIIERMKQSPKEGGTRLIPPSFTYIFGDLWNPIKHAMKLMQPYCYICESAPTTEIHHIRPKYLKGSRFDPANLVGLCEDCHDNIHRALDWHIDRLLDNSLRW